MSAIGLGHSKLSRALAIGSLELPSALADGLDADI